MLPLIGVTASQTASPDYMTRYLAYVESAGGRPKLLRPSNGPSIAGLDGILLTGGADIHPRHFGRGIDPATAATLQLDEERDAFEIAVGCEALDQGLPTLGICRGFQLLNVLHGGQLIQHLDGHRVGNGGDVPSEQHLVRVAPGTKLAALVGAGDLAVNSRHHQGVGQAELARTLAATAWAPDGLIEAFERIGAGWVVGVQWHPERVAECAPICRELAGGLIRAAEGARRAPAPRA